MPAFGDGVRSYLGGIVLVLGLVAGATAVRGQNVQHISAIVNDEVISAFDIEQRLRLLMASAQVPDTIENRRRLRTQVMQLLVNEKLQVQEARRLNIKLRSAEINERLRILAQQNGVAPGDLATVLAANNIQFGTVLAQLRAELTWNKLVRGRFAGSARVTEEDIDEVIARLNASKGKPEHLISEIYLSVTGSDEDEEVHQNAQRLADEIHGGADFASIARQFSEAATAARGGAVGWAQPGNFATELDNALNAMNVDDVSEPIRAEGGYYIVKIHDRRKIMEVNPLDTKVSLQQILLPLGAGAPDAEVAKQERLAAEIVGSVEGCPAFSATTRKLGTSDSGDMGTVRLGDLPEHFRTVVTDLEIGRPSPPMRRDSGIHILMVCQRETPPKMTPDRKQIRGVLVQKKMALMARRYLRDLRRDAVIEMR